MIPAENESNNSINQHLFKKTTSSSTFKEDLKYWPGSSNRRRSAGSEATVGHMTDSNGRKHKNHKRNTQTDMMRYKYAEF